MPVARRLASVKPGFVAPRSDPSVRRTDRQVGHVHFMQSRVESFRRVKHEDLASADERPDVQQVDDERFLFARQDGSDQILSAVVEVGRESVVAV